jgi:hypothetical protein
LEKIAEELKGTLNDVKDDTSQRSNKVIDVLKREITDL